MGQVSDTISPQLQSFIEAQHLFFVATAPTQLDGHLNLSPKGMDTFRVLSPTSVAYLDLTGSGIETAAHLAQNGRITFMFCAFSDAPLSCDFMEPVTRSDLAMPSGPSSGRCSERHLRGNAS